MATSTILQTLNPAADGGLASASHRRQEETFLAGGAIASGTVRVCISGVCEALVEGVNSAGANTAIAAGAPIGISDNAGVYGAFTAGTDAMPSGFCADAVAPGAATAKVTIIVTKNF